MVRQSELDEATVLALVDEIYAASTDGSRWQRVVDAISEALGGAAVALSAGRSSTLVPQLVHAGSGFREDLADEYRWHPERWIPANPYMAVVMGQPCNLVDTRAHLTATEIRSTLFYEDWMRPQGLGTGAVGSFWPAGPDGPGGGMAAYPTRRSGDFSDRQVRLLHHLDRHLIRSANSFALLHAARAERDAFLDVLDRLEHGVLLVDGGGCVLAANRAAEEILRQSDGLTSQGGELRGAGCAETRILHERIARAIHARGVDLPFGLPRPSGARALEVAVAPLRRHLPELGDATAAAVVFVNDPERRQPPVGEVLMALYGLTPAEAGVAAGLAAGLSIREYAEQAERSVETVRTLVKRIFAKTGTRRQAELVNLIASGPASLRRDDEG